MYLSWELFILIALAFVCFALKPRWGVAVLMLEAILGGNGHWYDFPDTTITPRYILAPVVVSGYIASKLFSWDGRFPRLRLGPTLAIFGVLVGGSVIHALVKSNPEPLQEAQVWLYLLLYPVIVDLWKPGEIPVTLLRILVWGTAAMALLQLLLMVLVNVLPEFLTYLYAQTPAREMWILISPVGGTSLLYVFWGNSALCGVVLGIAILTAGSGRMQGDIISAGTAWKIAVLVGLAMAFSMTRGTWGQLVVTILFLGFDFVLRRAIPWRLVLAAGVVLLGMAWIVWAEAPLVRDAFSERAGTLLADKSTLDIGDSLVVKSMEQSQLCKAIAARPFFGYGFGKGDYGEFGEIVAEWSRFHNYFLGFALKTGLVGLAILLLLLVRGCGWALRVGNRVRERFPERRALLFGMAYGFAGVLAATTTNPHLGVPAVIVTFALMLAVSDLAFTACEMQGPAMQDTVDQR